MPQCSVPGCVKQGGHQFPSDSNLSSAWIVAIRRSDAKNKGQLWKPTQSARVCQLHFKDTDYLTVNTHGKQHNILDW